MSVQIHRDSDVCVPEDLLQRLCLHAGFHSPRSEGITKGVRGKARDPGILTKLVYVLPDAPGAKQSAPQCAEDRRLSVINAPETFGILCLLGPDRLERSLPCRNNAGRVAGFGVAADNEFKFVNAYNDDGSIKSIDPIKYAQVFGKAVSDALTNKDFQKGYEAVATYFALASLIKDVNKQLADEYTAFYGSISPKFDEDFTEKYPMLAENYIDTLEEELDPAFWSWAGMTEAPVVPDNGWNTRDAK